MSFSYTDIGHKRDWRVASICLCGVGALGLLKASPDFKPSKCLQRRTFSEDLGGRAAGQQWLILCLSLSASCRRRAVLCAVALSNIRSRSRRDLARLQSFKQEVEYNRGVAVVLAS